MNTRNLLVIAFAATMVVGISPAEAGKPVSNAATSHVQSATTDALGVTTLLAVGGDNPIVASGDVYTSANGVVSEVATDWRLDLFNSTTRKLYVKFDDPLPGSPSNYFQPAYVRGRFESRLAAAGDTAGLAGMTLGQTKLVPMMITFNYQNNTNLDYRVSFVPDSQPGTDRLLVTCDAVSSSNTCSHWTVDPPGGPGSKAIGRLLKLTWVKGSGDATKTPLGDYYFTLHFEMSKP